MSPEVGFRLEQLMELAGLSCAAALSRVYPRDKYSRVLVVAGPGSKSTLVAHRSWHSFTRQWRGCARSGATFVALWLPATRHLSQAHAQHALFGTASIVTAQHLTVAKNRPCSHNSSTCAYRWASNSLNESCKAATLCLMVFLASVLKATSAPHLTASFKYATANFRVWIHRFQLLNNSTVPIVSIDIPSGWDVVKGNVAGQGLTRVNLLGTNLNIALYSLLN